MTPHQAKIKGKAVGSLLIEWERRGIGRIHRATGLPPTVAGKAQLVRLHAMLTNLYAEHRDDILAGIRDGRLAVRDVYAAWKSGGLDRLPTAEQLIRVADRLPQWLAETPNAHTAGSRAATMEALVAGDAGAQLADLPELLHRLRARTADRPSWFNHARTNLLAFLRDVVGPDHALPKAVRAIAERNEPPRKQTEPLSPEDMRAVVAQLSHVGPMYWSMCLTGMGPGEYWGRWEVLADRIAVHGTKTAGRDRIIPLVAPLTPAGGTVALLRYYLNKATPRLTPYDARRFFARAMEEAGIPRTRRKLYLGHAAQDITDLYERYEVTRFLLEDGRAIGAYLGITPPAPTLRKTA
jgi:integrase